MSDLDERDELDEYLAEALEDAEFARLFHEAAARSARRAQMTPGVDVTCWECAGWWRSERCTVCHPGAFPPPVAGKYKPGPKAARMGRRRR